VTKLRVSEVVAPKVRDIDSQRMLIRVHHGKGAADRYVMLSPRLLPLLRAYWKAHHPTDGLFPGRVPGKPLTTRPVKRICHEVQQRAELTKTVSPYTLRTDSTYYYSFQRLLYFSGSSACPTTG
jgi:integrase/recombinase XerD